MGPQTLFKLLLEGLYSISSGPARCFSHGEKQKIGRLKEDAGLLELFVTVGSGFRG